MSRGAENHSILKNKKQEISESLGRSDSIIAIFSLECAVISILNVIFGL